MTWRAGSGKAGLDFEAAVEEALCFGWVDSTGGRVDEDRGKLYFARRKPRSVWASIPAFGAQDTPRVDRYGTASRDAVGPDHPGRRSSSSQ